MITNIIVTHGCTWTYVRGEHSLLTLSNFLFYIFVCASLEVISFQQTVLINNKTAHTQHTNTLSLVLIFEYKMLLLLKLQFSVF
jgi:hypothetical protein